MNTRAKQHICKFNGNLESWNLPILKVGIDSIRGPWKGAYLVHRYLGMYAYVFMPGIHAR